MAMLKTKVELYLIANSKTWGNEKQNIVLANHGDEDFIEAWNVSGVTKPTDSQLDALETQANTYEENLITNKANNIASAKTKLEALGLSVDEIKEAFGI